MKTLRGFKKQKNVLHLYKLLTMSRIFIFLTACLFSAGLFGQFEVYYTAEEYQAGTPSITYPEHMWDSYKLKNHEMVIKHEVTKEKTAIALDQVWGMTYHGFVFRVPKVGTYCEGPAKEVVMKVAEKEGVVFWHNAQFFDDIRLSVKNNTQVDLVNPVGENVSQTGYVSVGLFGDMASTTAAGMAPGWLKEGLQLFLKENKPTTAWLQKCLAERKFEWEYRHMSSCFDLDPE